MTTRKDPAPAVYAAAASVLASITKDGIAKLRPGMDGRKKFHFRGIDDVTEAFAPLMAEAKLMVLPAYTEIVVTERKTNGGPVYNSRVLGTFTLMSLVDGSSFPFGSYYGEASDQVDKGSTKAQSVALRQAYVQGFIVPAGPDADPEATDHEESDQVDGEAPKTERPSMSRGAKGKGKKPAKNDASAADPITAGQRRVLSAKCKSKGYTLDDLETAFGLTIVADNFNDAMAHLNGMAAKS